MDFYQIAHSFDLFQIYKWSLCFARQTSWGNDFGLKRRSVSGEKKSQKNEPLFYSSLKKTCTLGVLKSFVYNVACAQLFPSSLVFHSVPTSTLASCYLLFCLRSGRRHSSQSKKEGNTSPIGMNWAKGFTNNPSPGMASCLATCITCTLHTGPGDHHTQPSCPQKFSLPLKCPF